MFATAIAMLQVRLAAAGWPVSLPTGQRRLHELDEPVTPPPPRPLPGELVSEAETLFTHWIGHAEVRLPAAALMTLWAHAACAVRDGSPDEARRIAAFLTEQLLVQDERYAEIPAPLAAPGEEQQPGYQALDPHLRRLISAAVRWCARADPGITPTIPHAPGPRTVHAIARWLVSQPDTDDWIYRGKEDMAGPDLITVEMPDHSRRVLRDRDVRAGNLTGVTQERGRIISPLCCSQTSSMVISSAPIASASLRSPQTSYVQSMLYLRHATRHHAS